MHDRSITQLDPLSNRADSHVLGLRFRDQEPALQFARSA